MARRKRIAPGGARVGRREPRLFAPPPPVPDAREILASIGEVAYEWHIEGDVLIWGANAGEVLRCADPAALARGRSYGLLLDPAEGRSRADVVLGGSARDEGAGVPYRTQYKLCSTEGDDPHWIEDVGRWFGGPDGKPQRAHGVVRVINERRAQEQHLAYLSQFDALTGEVNRWRLTELLQATIEEAVKFRSSCGFLLVAIDNLTRINEAYGYDVADEVIIAVAKRIRAQCAARTISAAWAATFGVILTNCTPDDMLIAAERLLAGVRDEVVLTKAGPVAVTLSIGGVIAPRHARHLHDVLIRAQEALYAAKAKRRGSFQAYHPNIERDAQRRENLRTSDEIVMALNERRIFLVFEPVVDDRSRQPAFYECLMRMARPDGSLLAVNDHPAGGAARTRAPARPSRARARFGRASRRARSARQPQRLAGLHRRSGLVVGARAMLRAHRDVAERLTIEITENTAIQDLDDTRGFVRG